MIQQATFDFLRRLHDHDEDKEWFEDHHSEYETAKDDLTALAADLIDAAADFDASFGPANPDPAACVARIHRDMRFQKGKKARYKDFWYVMLKSPAAASYYIQVKPGDTLAGGGVFTPDQDTLTAMRARIHGSYDRWTSIVESPEVEEMFPNGLIAPDTLKIAPHGYDPDDRAIEYLRMKGWCANRPLTHEQLLAPDAVRTVVQTFATIEPMVTFLNSAVR